MYLCLETSIHCTMRIKENGLKYVVLFFVLVLGFSACNKPKNANNDIDGVFTINNNFDELNARVKIVREPLSVDANLKTGAADNVCDSYTWYLVAEIDSPLYDSEPLSATDVRIVGERAYVSYNKKGAVPAGAVDIIDISDPTDPEIMSNVVFNSADINSLAVEREGTDALRKIYLAGSSKNGAVLRQVTAENDYFIDGFVDVKLSDVYTDGRITASANGISLSTDFIYMTSGNTNGGTFQIDKQTLEILTHDEYSSAKAIALSGVNTDDYQLSLIGGDDAKLMVYRVGTDRTLVREIPLGPIVHQNVDDIYAGKASLDISSAGNIVYITLNSRGVIGINFETNTSVHYSPTAMLSIGNNTGVAVDGKTIYLANGLDGLFIGCIPDDNGEISQVQKWGTNDLEYSTNMVQTNGDWVFVAKGGGGLKILRKVADGEYPAVTAWDEQGMPTPLSGNISLCANLIADLSAVLPDGVDEKKENKDYFKNENIEVVLNQEANVSVQFVSENSEYKNALGYYTYNVNNPPKKIEDIKNSMKIIFPNVSASGSGGSLVKGNGVNLGVFPSGTVIGYFLILNGWNGTEITSGLDTFFTLPKLNNGNKEQSLMLYSASCGALITTFEDVRNNKGDNDFNDVIIQTSISPMAATNTVNVIQIPNAK